MPKITRHTNKGYRYQEGGSVRGPDEEDSFDKWAKGMREHDEYKAQFREPEPPVSPEMARRSHDIRRAPMGSTGTFSDRSGGRESENVEDRRRDVPYRKTFGDTMARRAAAEAYLETGAKAKPVGKGGEKQFRDVDKLVNKLNKTKMEQPDPANTPNWNWSSDWE